MIRDDLITAISAALTAVGVEPPAKGIQLERPARREHGDWSSNVAMATAKPAGRNPRELAGELAGHLNAHPPAHVARGAGGGPRLRQLPPRRDLAPRRAVRRRRGGHRRLRHPRGGHRRAGDDRVRLGQPDRAGARGQRVVRLVRRRARTGAGALRVRRDPRVLRERHRRADPRARRQRAGPIQGRARSRGRLQQRLREGPRLRLRRTRRRHRGRPVGRQPHHRLHPAPDGSGAHRLRRVVQPGVHRGQRGRRRRPSRCWPTRAWCSSGTGPCGCAPATSATHARSG